MCFHYTKIKYERGKISTKGRTYIANKGVVRMRECVSKSFKKSKHRKTNQEENVNCV